MIQYSYDMLNEAKYDKIMKIFLWAVFFVLALSNYASSSGSCYNISNSDEQAYCLAKQGKGSCYAIISSDLRARCNALQNHGSCYNISNSDERAYCLAQQGKGSCYTIHASDLRARCLSHE